MFCVYQIVLHYDESSRVDIFGSQNITASVTFFKVTSSVNCKNSKSQNYDFKDKMSLNLPQNLPFHYFFQKIQRFQCIQFVWGLCPSGGKWAWMVKWPWMGMDAEPLVKATSLWDTCSTWDGLSLKHQMIFCIWIIHRYLICIRTYIYIYKYHPMYFFPYVITTYQY